MTNQPTAGLQSGTVMDESGDEIPLVSWEAGLIRGDGLLRVKQTRDPSDNQH